MESKEPSWTQQISNTTLCNFFYSFAVVYLVIGVLSVGGVIYSMLFSKTKVPGVVLFVYILTSGLSFTTMLFHYLICSRALIKN